MRTRIFICLFFASTGSFAQLNKLKGEWITSTKEFIFINDTTTNAIGNHLVNTRSQDYNFNLFIYGDTLSFQAPFYSTKKFNKMKYHDRYDLKIVIFTDMVLIVTPVSDFSKEFFKTSGQLTFKRPQYPKDSAFKFEKIVYHTSECYGTCNIYHLQVDSFRHFKLYAEVVYNRGKYFDRTRDTASQGYFEGQVNDALYSELIKSLENQYFTKLELDDVLCCDAPLVTIIVYFNEQRKYFKTMFPPSLAKNLIEILYNICETSKGTRTNEKFKLEE